ncbi:hypothetical protein RJ640_020433, partial [Escallonia rubra]
ALYNLGARKVIVTGVGQIGCIPSQLARYDANGNGSSRNEEINSAIVLFNSGLQTMVDCFNKGQLPGAKFVYLNAFETTKDLVLSASSYGIVGTFMQNIFMNHTWVDSLQILGTVEGFLAITVDAAKRAGETIQKEFYQTKHVEHKGQERPLNQEQSILKQAIQSFAQHLLPIVSLATFFSQDFFPNDA